MKLVFLKLSALLVIVIGVALVGQYVQCPYICSYLAKTSDGSLDALFPGSFKLLSGGVLILIGVYSFLPTFRLKKPALRTIKQNLENGIAEINLATVEKECEAMLKKVAPLKQVTVCLTPSKDQKKVCVEINPVVILNEGESLPDVQELLIHRIEEFLNTYFGLSIATPVIIKLDNIQLDSEKIYASLGKSAFEAISEKYEPTTIEEKQAEVSPTISTVSTTTKDEKLPYEDYLSCKIEEPKQEAESPLLELSDRTEESDGSDELDRSDKSDNPELPKF